MNIAKKQDLLNKKAEQYKTMDTAKKQDLSNEKAEHYKKIDTAKKQDLLNKKKQFRECYKNQPSLFYIMRLIKAALA